MKTKYLAESSSGSKSFSHSNINPKKLKILFKEIEGSKIGAKYQQNN